MLIKARYIILLKYPKVISFYEKNQDNFRKEKKLNKGNWKFWPNYIWDFRQQVFDVHIQIRNVIAPELKCTKIQEQFFYLCRFLCKNTAHSPKFVWTIDPINFEM